MKGGPRDIWDMHVSFVGETNRAWIDENHLKPFAGLASFKEERERLVGNIKDKVERNAKTGEKQGRPSHTSFYRQVTVRGGGGEGGG